MQIYTYSLIVLSILFNSKLNAFILNGELIVDLPEHYLTERKLEIIDPVEDPIDDPVEDPIDDPVEDPIDDPVEDPIDDPVEDPIEDVINPDYTENYYIHDESIVDNSINDNSIIDNSIVDNSINDNSVHDNSVNTIKTNSDNINTTKVINKYKTITNDNSNYQNQQIYTVNNPINSNFKSNDLTPQNTNSKVEITLKCELPEPKDKTTQLNLRTNTASLLSISLINVCIISLMLFMN